LFHWPKWPTAIVIPRPDIAMSPSPRAYLPKWKMDPPNRVFLERGRAPGRWPCGKGREAWPDSVGRTLCVHLARPFPAEPFSSPGMAGRAAGCAIMERLGEANGVIAGVWSPPLRGWPSHGEKALRGQSGGRREGRFSRRDALCASALQGLARATAFHRATWVAGWPWPKGDMPRSSSWHPSGRAEPAPPRDGLMGESPEMSRKAIFLEGGGLRVRVARPYASPGISFPPHVSKMTRGPSRDMCQLGPSHPCGRSTGASPARMA
jgi:hypothetical protein